MTIHNINDRIKIRRKELGITQKEIAKAVGVTTSSVTQWELGMTAPKGANLQGLSKVLQCTPDWLLYGKEPPKPESNATFIGGIKEWDENTPLPDDEVEIPFYKEVELSAGNGRYVIQEHPTYKLRFSKVTLKKNNVDPASASCVKVEGNSMEPVLPDGATVGVDTSKTTVRDGKMYALDHDGMLRVKMLYRLPGGGLRLRSFNSDEYPDESYSNDELKEIRIIGQVFWYSVLM